MALMDWPRRPSPFGSATSDSGIGFMLKALLVLFLLHSRNGAEFNVEAATKESVPNGDECRSPEATASCGQCIKQGPECAWCADPRLNSSTSRCDLKLVFSTEVCAPQYLLSPSTEIKVAPQHNLPLGTRRADSITPIQLEPQQVEIRMKPGDIVEVPFRYLHKAPASGYEVRDFTIQTSEYRSMGLEIDFSVDCNGERRSGRVCPGVQPEQKTNFYAKVSLNDCNNRNLIAVSVGIYGYNTVSAIFVTPVCGCDCENPRFHERRSPRCNYQGNMVCGVCQCDQGKGGDACECDLSRYGVTTTDELLGMCREHRTSPVCSGKGKCSCGKCTCNADYIRGKYCECDSADCPLDAEGRLCSGRGECECGRCVCERGFSGDDCACNDDPAPCTQNAVVCTHNGYCECGKCACNVGWAGAWCTVEQELPKETKESKESKESNKKSEEPSASSSSVELEPSEDESGEGRGDLLPVTPDNGHAQKEEQRQEEVGEDNGDTSHQLVSHRTIWIYLGSTLLALLIGLYVL